MSTKNFEQTDFLFGSNGVFIEQLYQSYLSDPSSVDLSWQKYFANIATGNTELPYDILKLDLSCTSTQKNIQNISTSKDIINTRNLDRENTLKARLMIIAYRERGHYLSKLDPLGLEQPRLKRDLKLELEDFGFSSDHLEVEILMPDIFEPNKVYQLKELLALLHKTYCDTIGSEFSHLEDLAAQQWLFEEIENFNINNISTSDKNQALEDLVEVESFEQYLHTKFPGAKRFSIEGGEAAIISANKFIEMAAAQGVQEAVVGMAHRGRLATLAKVIDKPYEAILSEFMGTSTFPDNLDISGDVKYHMGYSSDKIFRDKHQVHLSLCPNPSHLEAVNSVVSGKVRAKQDLIQDHDRKKVLAILIHGDAAFCGQGVVAENLIMSGLGAYDIGGTLHIVINNQVGFTANAEDTRLGRYPTEFAKIAKAPIIHVNGEDIDAVLKATIIAANYRHKFGTDIVIDITCYRKYGHNEGDEPMFTQSAMYNIIKTKLTPANIYADKLANNAVVDSTSYESLKEKFRQLLDQKYAIAQSYKPSAQWLEGLWTGFERHGSVQAQTGVAKDDLKALICKLCDIPKGLTLNSKIEKLFEQRIATIKDDKPIDWATGEQLAFATLLIENIPIRLTGQDCGRGTFSHRHSVLHSQNNDQTYVPLNHLSQTQSRYFVADSNLSEYAVLGFEYGYSQVNPMQLVIWEAQFGDFANGAQIMFDQFISSAETKWLRLSGLTMLLPHGFEGQGPEHSSARLERFLQLAAEENIRVAYPTTPASLFHLLRRQIYTNTRKPLIIMSPKSLLRHKLAVSALSDFDTGTTFLPILDENKIVQANTKKVILCSGKIYYDLIEARDKMSNSNIAIIRIEQLYPFAQEMCDDIISHYRHVKDFVWCQEEPQNMGAWNFIEKYLNQSLQAAKMKYSFRYIGRQASASPAVGSLYAHNKEQTKLVQEALAIN